MRLTEVRCPTRSQPLALALCSIFRVVSAVRPMRSAHSATVRPLSFFFYIRASSVSHSVMSIRAGI